MSRANILFSLFIILGICLGWSRVASKLPDDITKCPAGNKKCILNNINTVLAKHFEGSVEMGLHKLDPLALGLITLEANDDSPVNLNLHLIDQHITGFKTMKAINMKGFGKKPDGQHAVLFTCDFGTMKGTYKADGKILILPIKGEGNSTVSMKNARVTVLIDGESVFRNGQLYLNVKKTNFDLDSDRTTFRLENLFNGDKTLGDNFNSFLNENWRLIFDEMIGPITKELNKPLFQAIKTVFNTTPYTDIFET